VEIFATTSLSSRSNKEIKEMFMLSHTLLTQSSALLRGTCFAVALVLVSSMPVAIAQSVVPLDAFSGSQGPVKQTGVGTSAPDTESIGGGLDRSITVEVTSVQNSAVGNEISASVGGDEFSHSQDSGVSGTSNTLWTGFAGSDWSGFTGLVLELVSSDLGGPVTMAVVSPSGQSSLTKTVPGGVSSALQVDFPFSEFSGSADLSNITSLRMFVDGKNVADWDMRVELIGLREGTPQPVPGMTTVGLVGALLGLPLISVFLARRRRRS
jgi:hypothetical protein